MTERNLTGGNLVGKQVHKGERKRSGFWKSPEVMRVLRQFVEGKIDRQEAYRRLEITHYGDPMAAATLDWYLHRYFRDRRSGVSFQTGPESAVERAVIGEGGRLVIPAPYRQALALEEGKEVILRLEEGGLRILTPHEALRRAQMLVRRHVPAGRSLADELIAERRQEALGE